MHCRKIREWLIKQPETISKNQKNKLTAHLRTCEKCRLASQYLAHLEKEIQTAKETGIPLKITENIWQNVRHGIETKLKSVKQKTSSLRSRRRPLIVWGIPSIVGVGLLILVLLTKPWYETSSNESFDPSPIDVVIESAEIDGQNALISIFEVKNPDMTFIWLYKSETDNGG